MRKKGLFLIAGLLVFSSVSFVQIQDLPLAGKASEIVISSGRPIQASTGRELTMMKAYLSVQVKSGNLRSFKIQTEEDLGIVHHRYESYYQGVKVWGAQLIEHQRNGKTYLINGQIFDDLALSVIPALEPQTAAAVALADLKDPVFEPLGEPELLILPLKTGYVLAYEVKYARTDALMISFVEARTGAVLFKYNDVKTQNSIGYGVGILGDAKKLSVQFKDNKYTMIDLMRPGKLVTADMYNGEDIRTTYYINDTDNVWTDPVAVDAHAYIGWIYDYFYLVHNRRGMDGANSQLVVNIHYGKNYSNAFYTSQTNWLYFGDGDPNQQYPYTAALDIVGHEFAHGVTQTTSGLIYWGASGALNEAFSDIMGVSCEFFHQPTGNGYMQADWWEGEDIRKPFAAGRDLSDPHRLVFMAQYGWRYPDHYSEYYDFSAYNNWDNNGVHINQSIATHWFYLLANGGTNRKSGISVTGIGVGDAERIAYRGWVNYLTPNATFHDARVATIQAAVDLFGASSTQVNRVTTAWNAVGVY
jgi:Zn-dependent metalloprotease